MPCRLARAVALISGPSGGTGRGGGWFRTWLPPVRSMATMHRTRHSPPSAPSNSANQQPPQDMTVNAFPVRALLPKDTTQASAFLAEHPSWDGRGVVVAILDTGVDPNAPGLNGWTTDGKPKLTHLIDCTGSGDVSCATTHTLDLGAARAAGGPVTLHGLSGRTLTIPPDWSCPTGLFRLGLKNTLDLYPKSLVERLSREEGTTFQVGQAALLTRVGRELAALEAAPVPKEPVSAILIAKEAKEDARARLEVLKDLHKGYQDPGHWMDVVCFHDGTTWRAAVDVGQRGDLSQTRAMASYHEEREWATFSQESVLNYSVNIYDEGAVVSIVTCAGSHGTHVAAITAAHHPEDPRLNGVAPGAQIISLKIGDTRLGSMETGTGLMRAAIELSRLGVDVANISYGEAAAIPDWGTFIAALRDDVVNASGCIVLSSAGNAGPALSTVGAPGGSSSGIIGVGAYVNHDMMLPEYSMASKVTERPYTWSSRGPTLDGDVGVDLYAPGAAITSVPEYTVQNAQLMNGTSMSSPNASGCVALLVSALKASGLAYNPYSVKTALVNAGKDVEDPFGVPFIQVQEAWDRLQATQEGHPNHQLHYDVTVSYRHLRRGIYLREVTETRELQRIPVNVKPVFPRTLEPEQNKLKLATEAHICLRATAPWIQVPPFLHLNAGGRDFAVDVDPSKLAAGFHFGEIHAFESGPRSEAGPLFKIPVTVTKPNAVDAVRQGGEAFVQYKGLTFGSGDMERHFIAIPPNCNFAELTVRSVHRNTTARFFVHMIQLVPQTRYTKHETEYVFGLGPSEVGKGASPEDCNTFTKRFRVQPNVTLEVCLAQFWSSTQDSMVDVEFRFHSILATVSHATQGAVQGASSGSGGDLVHLSTGAHGFSRIDLCAPLRKESLSPSIALDKCRKVYRPTSSSIAPLLSRDVVRDTRQLQQLTLTYVVKVAEGPATLTPTFPRMESVLYDSAFTNFCCIVFDANKRSLGYQDVYPKAVKGLAEGTYTVRAQVTSVSRELLERLAHMPLVADFGLAKPVTLPLYTTLAAAVSGDGGATFKAKTLARGESTVAWVGEENPAAPISLKQVAPGDLLLGKLDLTKGEAGASMPIAYLVPPAEIKPKEPALPSGLPPGEPEKEETIVLAEELRDLELAWLGKLKKEENKRALFDKLAAAHPTHLPVFQRRLEWVAGRVEEQEDKPGTPVQDALLAEVREAATQLADLIPRDALAIYLGIKHELLTEQDKRLKKERELQQECLVLALTWQAKALQLEHAQHAEPASEAAAQLFARFEAGLQELSKWQPESPPTQNPRYLGLWVYKQCHKRLHGLALQVVCKFLADNAKLGVSEEPKDAKVWKGLAQCKLELLRECQFEQWAEYEERWHLSRCPTEYAPF